jgi:hypothetical protein
LGDKTDRYLERDEPDSVGVPDKLGMGVMMYRRNAAVAAAAAAAAVAVAAV